MSRRCDAVIFDLDGVLCSTDEYHYRAWKTLADRLGIPFDREVNQRLRGVSRMKSLRIVLERADRRWPEAELESLAAQKNDVYHGLLENLSPADLLPGTGPALETLWERGYLLAVGSSSKNTKLILRKIGLADFFDAAADGTDITRSKPDPEVLLAAAPGFVGRAARTPRRTSPGPFRDKSQACRRGRLRGTPGSFFR